MFRYHPGSSLAVRECKKPTNQEEEGKALKGGGLQRWECSTSQAAAEDAAGEGCLLRGRDGTSRGTHPLSLLQST